MGGSTLYQVTRSLSWLQRAAISLAGPGIGFVLGALVYYAVGPWLRSGAPRLLILAVSDLLWVTIGWGAFNLLPILPLDGSGVLNAVLSRFWPARAKWTTLWVSCVAGCIVAVVCIGAGQVFAGALAGLLAYNSLQSLRGAAGIPTPWTR